MSLDSLVSKLKRSILATALGASVMLNPACGGEEVEDPVCYSASLYGIYETTISLLDDTGNLVNTEYDYPGTTYESWTEILARGSNASVRYTFFYPDDYDRDLETGEICKSYLHEGGTILDADYNEHDIQSAFYTSCGTIKDGGSLDMRHDVIFTYLNGTQDSVVWEEQGQKKPTEITCGASDTLYGMYRFRVALEEDTAGVIETEEHDWEADYEIFTLGSDERIRLPLEGYWDLDRSLLTGRIYERWEDTHFLDQDSDVYVEENNSYSGFFDTDGTLRTKLEFHSEYWADYNNWYYEAAPFGSDSVEWSIEADRIE